MIAMTVGGVLLVMWIVFAAIAILGITAVLVWAVRTRQFADQDRARYLPLRSGVPEDAGDADKPLPAADDSRT